MMRKTSLLAQLLCVVASCLACSAPRGREASSPTFLATSSPSTPTTAPFSAESTIEGTVTSTREDRDAPTARSPTSSSGASIELTHPTGGETWLEGSSHVVRWRSSGVEKVDVEVASGGKPLGHVALGLDAMSGKVEWEIRVGLISDFGVARSDHMRVRLSSTANPDLYDGNDHPFTVKCPRIRFEPGATSGSATGTLEPDGGLYRYVLGASKGQTMEIEISPDKIVADVWGAEDGSTWEIPQGERKWRIAALPATQDYFVTLRNPTPEEPVDYVLDVAIR